ncbi:DUF5959 family protein [Streptomyces pseudovenezuelae]|uniref:BFN domain-containing protein n=1 Tax=Streptomyces pseudovenezuelae TaxID=67350 RepID=A0ABT6LDE1_9ACTN|nr:DUF5959 family protein [Streptomyces pseudovenezuelae]MDH6214325.1 hypothetical protein [Streptomyces pseudovenezuelae]
MAEVNQMDLVVLADDEGNSVIVKVLGQHPDVPDGLAAAIVIDTPFVSGSVDLSLWRSRLEEWGHALDRLEVGEDIAWLKVQRGPSLTIQLSGKRDCPDVIVEDDMISMVTVRVPIALPDGWIASQRERLRDLVGAWEQ